MYIYIILYRNIFIILNVWIIILTNKCLHNFSLVEGGQIIVPNVTHINFKMQTSIARELGYKLSSKTAPELKNVE